MLDRIVHFEIRVPGRTAYASSILSHPQAIAVRQQANRTLQPGHHVYAVYESGTVEGPVPDYEPWEMKTQAETGVSRLFSMLKAGESNG